MELTKEKICQLIDLYHERPILWDQTQSNYKNKFKKNDAWSEISEIMGVDKAEIEKKMKNLIGQFYRECKRMKSGAGADEVVESKWFAFKSLMFLKNKNKPRPTTEAGIEENVQVMNEMYTEEENVLLEINNDEGVINKQHECNISTDSTAQFSKEIFVTPKLPPNKNKKRKDNQMAEEAYGIMKSLVNKQGQRDEFHVFGEHVANKIRKLPTDYAKSTAEYLINNILYEAETGKYNFPPQIISPQMQHVNYQQPYYQNQSVSVLSQSHNQSSIPSSPASSTITSLASPTLTTPALSFIEEDNFDEVLHSI